MNTFCKSVIDIKDLANCGVIFPCRVEDGDGNTISKAIYSVDLKTGEVFYYPRNSEGRFSTEVVRDADGGTTLEVVKSRATYKTPIRLFDASGQDVTDKLINYRPINL